ncbi:hypothetical protein [Methylomagnum sp.]
MMVRYDKPEIHLPLPDPAPAALAVWLAELPLANTGYCLDALFLTLRAFNARSNIRPANRFKLTAMLAPYVEMLAERTEGPLLEASMPHPPAVKRAELGAQLYRQTALAYDLACLRKPRLGAWWFRDEVDTSAAPYRSLRYWGLYLLRMAQLYKDPEPGFWPLVYGVYGHAEQAGLTDTGENPPPHRTVRDLFKRIVLFALGDSGRLRPRDMRNAYSLLGGVAECVSLALQPPSNQTPGHFLIDPGRDGPPVPYQVGQGADSGVYFLDTTPLISRLIKDPPPDQAGPFDDPHYRHLKRVFAKGLCGARFRKSTRVPVDKKCRLYLGLPEIIRFLSRPAWEADDADSELPLAHLAPIDWTHRSRLELAPDEVDFSPRRVGRGERTLRRETEVEQIVLEDWVSPRDPIWEPAAPPSPKTDGAAQGDLLNTGPTGYCVFVDEAEHLNVQIGVPVGLVEEGQSMFLGTVRWLVREPTGFRFGLKLLAPKVEVVEVRAFDGVSKGKGLLLPADPVLRPEPELLVLPTVFEVSTELSIGHEHRPARAYLGRIYERTLSFTRMRLSPSHAGPTEYDWRNG